MDEPKLREALITSETCLYREALHEYLWGQLDFPDHYGRNLSALADCLAETAHPTLITIAIDEATLPTEMQAYVLKLAQICARESVANENISLIIEHR